MASKHAWKVELIPWDHTSEAQVARLYDQRVACGWRSQEVPEYVKAAEMGVKIFYWIVMSEALIDQDKLMNTHVKAFPKEAMPIEDTAKEIRLSTRNPTYRKFTPIGHVALAQHSQEEDVEYKLPAEGVVWIHQLYVSYALQKNGFGAAAMDQVEAIAAKPPLSAKILALDTIAQEFQMSPASHKACVDIGIPTPKVSTEVWYKKRGYETIGGGVISDYGGIGMALDIVFLKKTLS